MSYLAVSGTILQICKYGYASTSRRRCSVLRPHVVRASLHFPCGQLRRGRRGPLPPCRIQLGIADNTDVLLLKTEAAHVHVSYVTAPWRKSNSSQYCHIAMYQTSYINRQRHNFVALNAFTLSLSPPNCSDASARTDAALR